ncbi:hypothetical protein [Paenibacillus cisolokensis]|uniref:hypothetical protein n=1 Tax=Paenibacillus cisolokensis TaxID=1658519 RepID=UPI001BCD20E8|nr:hypothetical protein [Paenibacillus cisolokensis]
MNCKSSKPSRSRPIRYYNLKYDFGIDFPRWWGKYIVVARPRTIGGDVYLPFLFRYGGKIYDPVFTIVISPFGARKWRRRYGDSPLVFIGERRGRSYSYMLPEELPDAFLKPDRSDYDYRKYRMPFRLLTRMVRTAPGLLKSFRLSSVRCCAPRRLTRREKCRTAAQ